MSNKRWENYAYTPDTTADCSFSVTREGLLENTIYTCNFIAAIGNDLRRLVYGIQGLVNRDFNPEKGNTTMIYITSGATDGFWLDFCQSKENSVFRNMKRVDINSIDEFFDIFRAQFEQCGYVVWDNNVPATSNAAVTICGLDGYIPVRQGSDAEAFLKDRGIEEKMTLVGMFTGKGTIPGSDTPSTQSTKCDTYIWMLENYMDRCSAKYIAYILDGAPMVPDNIFSKMRASNVVCTENHDFLIARRCFCFDLAPSKFEKVCDDPEQPIGTDYATLCKIFARRFERANGDFGQIFGFPPWWLKYNTNTSFPDGTLTGEHDAVYNEWLFTEIITCYNLAKEADAAHPASMANGSFYYKYRFCRDNFKNNHVKEDIKFDPDVHYYTVYMGDYDSSAWLKHHVPSIFKDEMKGKISMMWGFNPNLSHRVPCVYEYIYDNLTEKDCICAGDSGAGYIMPSGLVENYHMRFMDERRPAENGDGRDKWAEYCREFYEFFDIDVTGFIINAWNPTIPEIFDVFSRFSRAGCLYNDANDFNMSIYDGVPFMAASPGFTNGTDFDFAYDKMFNKMQGNFCAYRTVCKTPSFIADCVEKYEKFCAEKGKKVKYVDVNTLFDLIKQSGQATEVTL